MLSICLLVVGERVYADSLCSSVRALQSVEAERPAQSVESVNERRRRMRRAQDLLGRQVAEQYLGGKAVATELSECLNRSQEAVHEVLSYAAFPLFDLTLESFQSSRVPALNAFVQAVRRKYPVGSYPILRLSAVDQTLHSQNLTAGFHRHERHLAFSIAQIPAGDWNLIFIHELLHLIDPKMEQGQRILREGGTFQRLRFYDRRGYRFAQLPRDEQQNALSLVEAALSQGLYAEYRAWAATDYIYNQAVSARLWQPHAVLLSLQPQGRGRTAEEARKRIYDHLKSRFPLQVDDFKDSSLFLEALAIVDPLGRRDPPALSYDWLR